MHQENLLNALANPGVALALLGLGVLGICWELSRGPLVVPGVAGSVCIVLAARTFDVWGAVLVAVSLICLIAEAAWRSRGFLTACSSMALLAALMRIDPNIGLGAGLVAAIAFSLLIGFLLSVAFEARRSKLAILKKGDTAHS